MKTVRLLFLLFFASAFNCLLPLSVSGQKIFQKTFRNYADGAYDFIMKNDSEFYFFGFSDPSTNNFDQPLIMKTDADANIIWSYVYGDTAYITHALDNGDGLVVFGEYTTAVSMFSTDIDYFVMKVDYNGNIIWQKRYGTEGYDFGQITPAADGGYLLTGSSRHIDQLLNIDSTF